MKTVAIVTFLLGLIGVVYLSWPNNEQVTETRPMDQPSEIIKYSPPAGAARAAFSTGCFWCIEPVYQNTPGVYQSVSGYAGGAEYNPTYEQVYSNKTGHRESVMVFYDPSVLSHQDILDIFWQNIDPTDSGGQFFDRGYSYTTAVYYETDTQKELAEASLQLLEESGKFDQPIATKILPYTTFYQAEEYHQDFYLKSPDRYESYSGASGRKEFKERIWELIQEEES